MVTRFGPWIPGLVPGYLSLVPGYLGLFLGSLGLVPGSLGLIPRSLGLVPGSLGLVPRFRTRYHKGYGGLVVVRMVFRKKLIVP